MTSPNEKQTIPLADTKYLLTTTLGALGRARLTWPLDELTDTDLDNIVSLRRRIAQELTEVDRCIAATEHELSRKKAAGDA